MFSFFKNIRYVWIVPHALMDLNLWFKFCIGVSFVLVLNYISHSIWGHWEENVRYGAWLLLFIATDCIQKEKDR